MTAGERVRIRYRRVPDRERTFRQVVVARSAGYVVTLLDAAPVERPVTVGGRTVLDPRAPVVWFTYPGLWHDVGRFHRADGAFTGVYANVLTPVRGTEGAVWDTTDLLLDVWRGADGRVEVLDRDEFAEARRRGWIDAATAERAEAEAEALADAAREGRWPPPHVDEWTLEAARAALAAAPSPEPTDR